PLARAALPFRSAICGGTAAKMQIFVKTLTGKTITLEVDENGKISRLRRECPSDECGAGVFMASHFDRHYCGKCCLTYCFNKPEDK
ncbi:hypothetical protein A6R68_21600, partial [Neotoma lepida]